MQGQTGTPTYMKRFAEEHPAHAGVEHRRPTLDEGAVPANPRTRGSTRKPVNVVAHITTDPARAGPTRSRWPVRTSTAIAPRTRGLNGAAGMTQEQIEWTSPKTRRLDLVPKGQAQSPQPANPEPTATGAAELLDPATELGALGRFAAACTLCDLHRNRTNGVFGTGDPQARLAFIGEGPGPSEDAAGEPFTGRSGKLLDRILTAMGVGRAHAFLTNVVCCRLDDPRTLERASIEACRPLLEAQLQIVAPEVIVPLGMSAWRWFEAAERRPMSEVRGHLYRWRGTVLAPTYHPAFLLRDASKKSAVWDDMQRVMRVLSGEEDITGIKPVAKGPWNDSSSQRGLFD